MAVGCDKSGSQDIWFTSREVGSASEWFPPPTNWSTAQSISEGNSKIDSISSIVDADGKPHFLWVQEGGTLSGSINNSIYYGQWANDHFSIPIKILESPDSYVDQFSTAYDSTRNRLVVSWNDGSSGKIYYSWAENSSASSVFEWFQPTAVPTPQVLGSSPDILAGRDGTIYIVYSIPINEGRGIYLVTSTDGGETWSEPLQVFNASRPDWQVAGNPLLTQASDGSLHLLWTRRAFLGNESTISLYYARSTDGGLGWSEPQIVDDSGVEKSWIIGGENQEVFRFWLDREEQSFNLIQQTSINSGESWSPPQNLTGLGETPAAISIFHDLQDRIQLVQILERSSGDLFLTARKWDADKWSNDDSTNIGPGTVQDVGALASGPDHQNALAIVYSIKATDIVTDTVAYKLALTILREGAAVPTAIPTAQSAVATSPSGTTITSEASTPEISTPEPEPSPSPKPTETSRPAPTAVPVLDQTIPEPALSPLFGVMLGGVLSVVVILIFLVYNRIKRP